MMTDFTIFFSWQSDLSKNKTTGFIDECLSRVANVLKGTITVKSDRATQGLTGSPDITESIFGKIDECDLFVADMSIINNFQDDEKNRKLTPNPNVLLETGYAARALEWNRVICLFNEEFGSPADFPFDIDHRRLTPFKFTAATRETEVNRIAQIIIENVVKLKFSGGIQRRGKAYYQIGGFDFTQNTLIDVAAPYIIREGDNYKKRVKELLEECKILIEEIEAIPLTPGEKDASPKDPMEQLRLTIVRNPVRKELKAEEIATIQENTKSNLGIELPVEFFNLGNLKVVSNILDQTTEYQGTKQEKRKIELIEKLEGNYYYIKLMDIFAATFDDYCLIPLAIKNISDVADSNITIVIRIIDGCTETVVPTKSLFTDDYKSEGEDIGLEGIVYDEGLIEDFFTMHTNSHIQYETNTFIRGFVSSKTPTMTVHGFGYPDSDAEDYERELQIFLKEPLSSSEYQYEISAIRAGETMWFGPLMVMKSSEREIRLSYSIISDVTSGDLQGEIIVKNNCFAP